VLLPTYCQPKGGKKKMFEIIQVNFNALFSFSYQAGFSESITIPFSSDEEEKNVRAARCTIHRVAQINNRRAIIVLIMAKQHWDRNLLFPNENYAFLFLLLNVLKKWVLDRHQIVFNLVHK
jgi:hypothetical protein